MTNLENYTAVISGLGNIAWKYDCRASDAGALLTHAGTFLNHEKVTLAGGFSPDENDRNAFHHQYGVRAFSDFYGMIDETSPRIVSICSPARAHFEQTAWCIDHGIPMVWLEKPPAESLEQMHRLLEKQSLAGHQTHVLVNYQRRFCPGYGNLRTIFRENRLGKCRLIQINYSRGLETNGSHMLDILFFIVGDGREWELEWVSAFGNSENPSFAVRFDDGTGAVVSGIDLPYHCIDVTLVCDDGRVSIVHGGMTHVMEMRVEHKLFPGFYRLETVEDYLLGQPGFEMGMVNALENLIQAHETGCKLESSLQTALNAQILMDQIRKKQTAQ